MDLDYLKNEKRMPRKYGYFQKPIVQWNKVPDVPGDTGKLFKTLYPSNKWTGEKTNSYQEPEIFFVDGTFIFLVQISINIL